MWLLYNRERASGACATKYLLLYEDPHLEPVDCEWINFIELLHCPTIYTLRNVYVPIENVLSFVPGVNLNLYINGNFYYRFIVFQLERDIFVYKYQRPYFWMAPVIYVCI